MTGTKDSSANSNTSREGRLPRTKTTAVKSNRLAVRTIWRVGSPVSKTVCVLVNRKTSLIRSLPQALIASSSGSKPTSTSASSIVRTSQSLTRACEGLGPALPPFGDFYANTYCEKRHPFYPLSQLWLPKVNSARPRMQDIANCLRILITVFKATPSGKETHPH